MNNLPSTEYIKKLDQVRLSDSARVRIGAELDSYIKFHPAQTPVRVGGESRFIQQVPTRTTWFTQIRNIHIMPMTIAILIALMIGGGTTFAAQSALPGDFLYPVKVEVTENIKSAFAFGADAEAELQAELLAERVAEVETLQARGELTAEESIAIASRVRAQSEDVRQASEESSPEIAATTRAQAEISLRQYNAMVANDGSLTVDIDTIVPPTESDTGTNYPPTETQDNPSPVIDCDRIPMSTGPESLQWQEACGEDEEDNTKVNITTDIGIRSDEIPYDCGAIPTTMGPESLAWKAACQGDDSDDDVKIDANGSVNLSI